MALWAAILLEIELTAPVGRAVSRMDDDIVAMVALHANSLGLLAGLDTSRWRPHMSRAGLYEEHWLLAYEALHHGWLPSTDDEGLRAAIRCLVLLDATSCASTMRRRAFQPHRSQRPPPCLATQAYSTFRP